VRRPWPGYGSTPSEAEPLVASRPTVRLPQIGAATPSYSPECVEGLFCELRLEAVLRSSHCPGTGTMSVTGSD
jgi:hypothetical protein